VEAAATLGPDAVLYLYGFVRLPIELPDLRGVDDTGVFVVTSADVGCVASSVDAGVYQPAVARTSEAQFEWVAPRALRHHDLLQRVHAAAAVVPLKFGTLAPSLDAVRSILLDHRDAIAALLARFENTDEWTLRISIDTGAVAADLLAREPALTAMRADVDGLSEGHAWFARKRLQKATDERVAQVRAALEDAICERVAAGTAVSAVMREPRPANADGARGVAVLVAREGFTHLQSVLADLEAEYYAYGLAFDLVGPWAPYSFAAASASW